MDIAFLIGRILFGGFFIMNGINHFTKSGMLAGYPSSRNFPGGKTAVMIGGIVILLGGFGILLGVLVEWAIALLVIFLLAASFGVHHFWSDTDPMMKMSEMTNFMKNMALIGAALMMLMIESWPYAIQ